MKLLRSTFGPLHRYAFIFDKDGTLLDTESINFEAFDRLLKDYEARHDHETHARMMGASIAECLRILQQRHAVIHQGEVYHDLLERNFRGHVGKVFEERGLPIMQGASNLLHAAREERLPIAMATSDHRASAEKHLGQLGWRRYFHAVVGFEDVTRIKPAPDVFLEAARRLGVIPERCIVFEDGPRGAEGARAAGMKIVFIRDPRFGINPRSEHVDLVVDSLDRLFG